ncbi:glycine-rich cell wall structural protein 1-like [Beta vulgaris subsp. vulgaris]|uniref:glycine-rich cell wall structural protein 1-like n=1 Tax=Beta vulgaris subsp. vulgaris TaxID=3555 RepID=UPI002036F178|nr:glycine-rich cell wall structural protein 1-like [Beta vulgaris subsp. vulgaris]
MSVVAAGGPRRLRGGGVADVVAAEGVEVFRVDLRGRGCGTEFSETGLFCGGFVGGRFVAKVLNRRLVEAGGFGGDGGGVGCGGGGGGLGCGGGDGGAKGRGGEDGGVGVGEGVRGSTVFVRNRRRATVFLPIVKG